VVSGTRRRDGVMVVKYFLGGAVFGISSSGLSMFLSCLSLRLPLLQVMSLILMIYRVCLLDSHLRIVSLSRVYHGNKDDRASIL
jgi:hypothetical protein